MVSIASYILYLGLLFLSFSIQKHHKEVFGRNLNDLMHKMYFMLGWALLFTATVLFMLYYGVSLGIVCPVLLVTPLIVLVALLLTYVPKAIVKLSVLFLPLAIVFLN
jgi:hypothetical protein